VRPSRSAVVFDRTLLRSRSSALEAVNSCEKLSRALPSRIASTIPASVQSRTIAAITAAATRIRMSGLANCRSSS
jgi:hypothetical protein